MPQRESDAAATKRRVAVVHGRNEAASKALFDKLRDFRLEPVEWDELLTQVRESTPSVFSVVQQLFKQVQAVVVLMTPDDEARLRQSFWKESDDLQDRQLSGQPRPNVLVEAGMAFARYPRRTLLVEIGNVRIPSDFRGMMTIRLDGTVESIQRLARRLAKPAGCAVEHGTGTQWLDVASFKDVVDQMKREAEEQRDPLSIKNQRGKNLYDGIASTGLVDIENRGEWGYEALPPEVIYNNAGREVAISGISCHSTFVQHIAPIWQVLNSGRSFRVLMLHPDSPDLERINRREKHNVGNDIRTVIDTIKLHDLHSNPAFSVRFAPLLMPFTAVMLDGDLSPTGGRALDDSGVIRVQPGVVHGTQHRGPVFQFTKKPDGAFEYFASDFREQWRRAVTIPELAPQGKEIQD